MAALPAYMNSIRSLHPGREAWKIRARVVRKWEMAPTSEPSKPYSLQLVLIDSEVIFSDIFYFFVYPT